METHPTAKKNGWKVEKDFPVWGNNELYLTTITGGYLLKEETPFEAYKRIAKTAARIHKEPLFEKKIFDILWKGWLIPSTPVMGNFGNEKGLPISCFSSRVGDSMYDIYRKNLEMAILSKHGGGTAYDFTNVRPIGTMIKEGTLGTSDGIIPFIKSYDSTIIASKQGCTRRGAVAIYLNIEHKEYPQFLEIREPKGDVNRQCHNIHQGAVISDEFMRKVIEKNGYERELWLKTIKKRVKTGEPYLFFIDNANKNLPQNWKENDLKIWHSNLCSEIMLPTDENHTLVCCLSSLNLDKYDDWKDTDTVSDAIMFLDSVIQEFLDKSHDIHGIEDAVRFAEKSRALGLGVLGWHSYLQSKMIPFISLEANSLTRKIFGKIKEEAERTTQYLAKKYKETLWTKNTGRRNLTLTTVAPTRSSAKLAGGLSQGIEPIAANIYVDDDAKGMHIRKNVKLESLLKKKKLNTPEMWDHIAQEKGSCQNIKALTQREREVFKCFKEINQLELIRQASIRQNYIDQGQSINLAFPQNAPARFINKVHIEAWKMGLKSLYYYRSESILRAETNLYSECLLCEI